MRNIFLFWLIRQDKPACCKRLRLRFEGVRSEKRGAAGTYITARRLDAEWHGRSGYAADRAGKGGWPGALARALVCVAAGTQARGKRKGAGWAVRALCGAAQGAFWTVFRMIAAERLFYRLKIGDSAKVEELGTCKTHKLMVK